MGKNDAPISYTDEEIASWDQRKTLRPPPYKGLWSRIAEKGMHVGDPFMDHKYADFEYMLEARRDAADIATSNCETVDENYYNPNSRDSSGISTASGETNSSPDEDSPQVKAQYATPEMRAKHRLDHQKTMNPLEFQQQEVQQKQPVKAKSPLRCPVPGVSGSRPARVSAVAPLLKNQSPFVNPKNMQSTPKWVELDKVKRGQQVCLQHLAKWAFAASQTLLAGFSLARFSTVLHAAGYTQSKESAAKRYMATFYHIVDWFQFDLTDFEGRGLRSIYTVRALHAHARRMAKPIYHEEELKEHSAYGLPLSQYDMACVHLDFCMLSWSVLEVELGFGKLPRDDMEAVVHLWRLIGYHLGIQDSYNICSDGLEVCEQYLEEWMLWMPRTIETARPEAGELRDAVLGGFGMTTGMPERIWRASFLQCMCHTPRFDLTHIMQDPKHVMYIEPSNYSLFLRLAMDEYHKTILEGQSSHFANKTMLNDRYLAVLSENHEIRRRKKFGALTVFQNWMFVEPLYHLGRILDVFLLNNDANRAAFSPRNHDNDRVLARTLVGGSAASFVGFVGLAGVILMKRFEEPLLRGEYDWGAFGVFVKEVLRVFFNGTRKAF